MKKIIILLVFFLTIGFASISTVLDINGTSSVSFKYEDFKVYISDLSIDGKEFLLNIADDGQSFFYNSNGNNEIEYTITNESYQYDVDINLVCDNQGDNVYNIKDIAAQSKKVGTINSNNDSLVSCRVEIDKIGRTEIAPDKCLYDIGQEWYFDYTGSEQKFPILCSGLYKLEVWGASGGEIEYSRSGYGGYSVGFSNLAKGEKIYVNVGEEGKTEKALTLTSNTYALSRKLGQTYNGGGGTISTVSDQQMASGGGATHIATVSGELYTLESYKDSASENSSNEILIVAGGGGGTACWNTTENGWWCKYEGGAHSGGGYKTNSERDITSGDLPDNWRTIEGSTQSSGFAFGKSGYAGNINQLVGGGGGWYGGFSSAISGTGGSGYINSPRLISYNEISKHMMCYECVTSEQDNIRTITSSNFSHDAISDYAKKGNGFAKITFVGEIK